MCSVFSQIRLLVANLTKKTFKSNIHELQSLVKMYGFDAQLHLLRCLVEEIDFRDQKSQKDQARVQLFIQEIQRLQDAPNFPSLLCQAIERVGNIHDDFLSSFVKTTKLPLAQQIALGVGLVQTGDEVLQAEGLKFMKSKVSDFCQSQQKTLSEGLLHSVWYLMNKHEGFAKQLTAFTKVVKQLHPDFYDSPLAAPFSEYARPMNSKRDLEADAAELARENGETSISRTVARSVNAAGVMQDLGYGCCADLSTLQNVLSELPPLNETAVSEIVAMMALTHTGLSESIMPLNALSSMGAAPAESSETTWNLQVFVNATQKAVPSLDWRAVIAGLDSVQFVIRDKTSVRVIVALWRLVTDDPFPAEMFFNDKIWHHRASQIAFLKQVLLKPDEGIDFIASSGKKHVITLPQAVSDLAKTPAQKAKCEPWRSLDLIETLLTLADSPYYSEVRSIFEIAMNCCPEALLLALSTLRQGNTSHSMLMQDTVTAMLVPHCMQELQTSSLILPLMWEAWPSALVGAMIESFRSAGMKVVPRLLDIGNGVKQLTLILDMMPHDVAFEVACLAYRREFLNLEQWLSQRLGSCKAAFASACITFLKEKGPDSCAQAPGLVEALAVFWRVLQPIASQLSVHDQEELHQAIARNNLLAAAAAPVAPAPVVVNPPVAKPAELTTPMDRMTLGSDDGPSGGVATVSPQSAKNTLPPQPTLINEGGEIPASALSSGEIIPPTQDTFPADIEEEANSYFQKIFTSQQSINDVIAMLQGFKNSANTREQQIFDCMIHNLLDEYRFFPEYPERELHITAVLFGSLIQHNLVTSVYLGIALSYVLEALRKVQNQKMLSFGLNALEQFKGRLAEWPTYCQHILQVQHIMQTRPDVHQFVEEARKTSAHKKPAPQEAAPPPAFPTPGAQQQPAKPAVAPAVPVEPPKQVENVAPAPAETSKPPSGVELVRNTSLDAATKAGDTAASSAAGVLGPAKGAMPGLHSTINIDTLVSAGSSADMALPGMDIQDRLHFLINNLTAANLKSKVEEMKTFFSSDHFAFLAHLIVTKRAAVELNNHTLYLNLLDEMDNKPLFKMILHQSHHSVRALLQSKLIRTSSAERTLLKNLGSWLGRLTLARNRPILHKDCGLKDLILDAYERGLLIAVMPFVAKVLEASKMSKVFKPTQPWIASLLSLLCELHSISDLKLNLKFEVEVLCRNLSVSLAEVPKSSLLTERHVDRTNNHDFTNTNIPTLTPSAGAGGHFSMQPNTGGQFLGSGDPSKSQFGAPSTTPAEQTKLGDPNASTQPQQQVPQLTQPGSSSNFSDHAAFPNLSQCVTINSALPLFSQQQHLQRLVPVAIDRAIREIISPVVERSVTIACITTRELIIKDLAMEPDERTILKAAHLMVQSLAGSLALVTCKDPLRVSMGNHLRTMLHANTNEQNLVEQVVQFVTTDNLDLGCSFIEKAATDKAVHDIDETLTSALAVRRKQPPTGRPASLPEFLHPKGPVHAQQMRIYEDFARLHPSTQQQQGGEQAGNRNAAPQQQPQPTASETAPNSAPWDSDHLSMKQVVEQFTEELSTLEGCVQKYPSHQSLESLGQDNEVSSMVGKVVTILSRAPQPIDDCVIACAQKVFRNLFDGAAAGGQMHIEAHLALLGRLGELSKGVAKEVTTWLIFSDEDRKLSKPIVLGLLRSGVINMAEYSSALATLLDQGRNANAVGFAIDVAQACVLDEQLVQAKAAISPLLEALSKIRYSGNQNEALAKLLKDVHGDGQGLNDAGQGQVERRSVVSRDKERANMPTGLAEKVTQLFKEWMQIYEQPHQNDKQYASFISQLQQQGMVKGDETTDNVFKVMVELAIDNCTTAPDGSIGFESVDAFSKLVVLLVKYLTEPVNPSNTTTRVVLLNKVLQVIGRVTARDCNAQKNGTSKQRPYFRLFTNLFVDLNAPDPALDVINLQVLGFFSNELHKLQPCRCPGFAFAWLELISHRMLMPKLLMAKAQRGWPLFQRLLADLLKFLQPHLSHAELSEPIRLLYKGTLRVLLVLLHDFPEFLCDYHFSFCDVIPNTCVQLRNLVLSAFPRQMRLPDPFTPNLKVDLLPEISQSPRILSKYATTLGVNNLKQDIDVYLKNRPDPSFLNDVLPKLKVEGSGGRKFSAPMINALVLHVGVQAIGQLQAKASQVTSPSAPMDIFQWLANSLDHEGRYLFLNAIANQLRYPNNHTHYFSCVLLYLFMDAQHDVLKEQITRVLLERLIVNRPHPWGLLITFIELIKNPRYNFWNHQFTRCAPEIERLFESVARSCMGPANMGQTPHGANETEATQ
jgi:CCR4-NOT transcription complex subunit 1